jgi:hypothetical protein
MEIKLRKRKQTKNEKISLYLDIYKGYYIDENGKKKIDRQYENLKLYLIDNPKNEIEKKQNKDIFNIASQVKAKRELEIKSNQHGISTKDKNNISFLNYCKDYIERNSNIKNINIWNALLNILKKNISENFKLENVNAKFCEDVIKYIDSHPSARNNRLKQNSKQLY